MAMKHTRSSRCVPQVAMLLLVSAVLAGCVSSSQRAGEAATDGSVTLEIEGQTPTQVVDAVRDTLMDYRFGLDRIDAQRGVITTHPKRTAGLASPWDLEQSSIGQEFEDLVNEQRRVVRVEFEPSVDEAPTVDSLRVTVELLRTHRPYWRVQSESIRMSTHARSRDAQGRAEPGHSTEIIGLDGQLAQRIAGAIDERLRMNAAGER